MASWNDYRDLTGLTLGDHEVDSARHQLRREVLGGSDELLSKPVGQLTLAEVFGLAVGVMVGIACPPFGIALWLILRKRRFNGPARPSRTALTDKICPRCAETVR